MPFGHTGTLFHHRPHPIDASLGIDEGAVFLEERRAGQEHVRESRRLVQEEVLNDDEIHREHRRLDVLRIGVRLRHVLALHVHALELTGERRVEHVRNPESRLAIEFDAPVILEHVAYVVVRHRTVARELVWKATHVTRTLNIVLAPQRVHSTPQIPDVAGRHGEVGHTHDHGGALAVLGHAEAVIDRGVAAGGIETGRRPDVLGRDTARQGHGLRRILLA